MKDLSTNVSNYLNFEEIKKNRNEISHVIFNNEPILVEVYIDKMEAALKYKDYEVIPNAIVIYKQKKNKCIKCFLLGLLIGLLIGFLLGSFLDIFKNDEKENFEEKATLIEKYKKDIFETHHIKTQLKNGIISEFKIAVVSQEFKWKKGSHTHLENGQFFDYIMPFIHENEDFKNAKALIALGNASEEIQNSIKPKLRIRDFKRIIHLIIPET